MQKENAKRKVKRGAGSRNIEGTKETGHGAGARRPEYRFPTGNGQRAAEMWAGRMVHVAPPPMRQFWGGTIFERGLLHSSMHDARNGPAACKIILYQLSVNTSILNILDKVTQYKHIYNYKTTCDGY